MHNPTRHIKKKVISKTRSKSWYHPVILEWAQLWSKLYSVTTIRTRNYPDKQLTDVDSVNR